MFLWERKEIQMKSCNALQIFSLFLIWKKNVGRRTHTLGDRETYGDQARKVSQTHTLGPDTYETIDQRTKRLQKYMAQYGTEGATCFNSPQEEKKGNFISIDLLIAKSLKQTCNLLLLFM